jgi:putative ABC transport system permease protein
MIANDLRYALRTLVKQRGFTAVALLTLAIALASNTAIFSVVNAILLRPLPFAAPEQLVDLSGVNRLSGEDFPVYSYLNYVDVREQTRALQTVSAFTRTGTFLLEGDEPVSMTGLNVTANLPELLGVKPQLGRFFTKAEDREGGPEVIVLSHEIWQRHFHGDPGVIGRSIRVGTAGRQRTVVGVMPPGFRFPIAEGERDYYLPFEPAILRGRERRDAIFISVVARMRAGTTLEQARADLSTIAARLEKQHQENTGLQFRLESMHERVVRDVRPALLILFGAVAVVLLIGCANVANLLLARATARHKEISIRASLGASPGRITMQLLVESVLLSVGAGALGLLFAAWGIDALLAFAPPGIPRLESVSLDGRVLLFTTALSVLTGIAFGLAPAISASRPNLTEALKEGTRGSTEGRRNRLRSMLVVAAVALSLMLLAGAGLLLRSFIHVTGIDAGYDHRNAVALDIAPRSLAYADAKAMLAFDERLLDEIRRLPGVMSVGAADTLPLRPQQTVWSFTFVGRPAPPPGREPSAQSVSVMPGFFESMRIPLLRGRGIAKTDVDGTPKVTVVNEAFVREHFPNEDPIGKQLQLDTDDAVQIVGVVGDVRWQSLTDEPHPMMFQALAQRPNRQISVVVRSNAPDSLPASLRALVRRLDPQQPITRIDALAGVREESLAARRFNMILLGALAVIALVLAAVGIFSVMSYSVTQRTTEIGIRMALGAESIDVVRLIVGHASRLVAAGVALGIGGAMLASRAITSLLYGVRAADPWTFAAIVVLIAGTALVASWLPARRAARVDPLVAIRYD